ncbi:MAG: permease-like cell division protein FtsX [Bacteroidaceae bacterium]|nr:permease-like cell division protein FtsX [Bacteroidaceae bacterium]
MAKRHNAPGMFSTQFITALISTSLVLVMLGTIVLFVFTARNLSSYVRENINISILLNDDISNAEIENLQSALEKQNYVKSLKYISKERALLDQCNSMGTDPSEFLGYNPFTASFEIKVNAAFANNKNLGEIEKQLKSTHKVMDVVYQKELMNSVNKNIRKFSMILLIIAALFTYISFALINNTVRLTIFSKRFIINTMKLVGASWGFIRRPFLSQSFLLGVLSAIAADIVILGGVRWLMTYEPEINAVINWEVMIIVGISVLVFGLLITYLCTYFSLSKYLKMSSNELYHI